MFLGVRSQNPPGKACYLLLSGELMLPEGGAEASTVVEKSVGVCPVLSA